MAIRRFREHVARQDWFAVLVDIGIVVLGVFLGTQVANWNEERLEVGQAREFRDRLIAELEFDEHQYQSQLAYYRRAREYGLSALSAFNGTSPLSDRDFAIAAYQLTQTDTTRAKSNVYDEMTARGLVGKLGSPETQEVASDFYLSVDVAQRSLETTFPYRTMLREVMPYGLQIRIRKECGDRNVYFRDRLVGVAVVHPCPMTITPTEAGDAVRRIRATPGMGQQMTRYVASLDEKIDNVELALIQARLLRNRLLATRGSGPA
jgi:hypothetical protein